MAKKRYFWSRSPYYEAGFHSICPSAPCHLVSLYTGKASASYPILVHLTDYNIDTLGILSFIKPVFVFFKFLFPYVQGFLLYTSKTVLSLPLICLSKYNVNTLLIRFHYPWLLFFSLFLGLYFMSILWNTGFTFIIETSFFQFFSRSSIFVLIVRVLYRHSQVLTNFLPSLNRTEHDVDCVISTFQPHVSSFLCVFVPRLSVDAGTTTRLHYSFYSYSAHFKL